MQYIVHSHENVYNKTDFGMRSVLTENKTLKTCCMGFAIKKFICKPKTSVDKNDNPIRFYISCAWIFYNNQASNIFVFLTWEKNQNTYF